MVFNCFMFFLSKKKHLHCLRELLSERWKFSMKNQKNVRLLLKLLEKWLAHKIRKFWMVFNCFLILLNPCRKNGKTWFWRFQKFHKLSTSIIREPQGKNAGDEKNLHPGAHTFIFLIDFLKYSFFFSFFCFFLYSCFFCLFVCFLKLKTCILIHIRLCGRVSDKNSFTWPISGNNTTFFHPRIKH